MLNYSLLGERIGKIRNEKGLSQAELAELTDLSTPYISYIENAKKSVSLTALVDIATALDTTVDTLLGGNLGNRFSAYHDDLAHLLRNCSIYERQILFDIAVSLKSSLRANHCLLDEQNRE